ncbi:CMP-N-acetylneuraminate-poly-alpha-2,8-sialyltransferase-like isoform X2 [Acanthaster planci]|nr:CMP-N-acetylneuraminate-poly-alpha-2,8-sialyltransferase-like isoform X2 [Acanthaster planci]XP_022102451.1 CMP-N-acetylneuraminate-poly-alpha-2,8-sialyltransferase-like isoform X2 [Acanthaster planci]
MRSFQKKYTSPYKVQQLTAAMRKLNKAQRNPWSYDQHQLDTFRRDLFLALKLESGAHPFHLTKRNTPVGSTLPFYQAGKEQRVTKSLWSSLPEDSIVRSDTRFPTCSVVGSSGILLGSRCGEEIDRSEFVIRFNLATVRGFEADVGHKTNLTTLNPTYVRNRFGSLKTEQNISAFKASLEQFHGSLLWLPAFGVRGFQVPLLKVASILAKGDVMTPVYGNPRHFLAVKSLWRPLLKRKKLPTTGLYMLTAAFEFCDHIKLFGAWPFEKSLRNQTVSYHYHDNLAISRHHSFHAEFLQILKLHHLGIIKLQYSECL